MSLHSLYIRFSKVYYDTSMTNNSKTLFNPLVIPQPSLPRYVQGYSMPKTENKLLSWSFVDNTLYRSNFYWLATIDNKGLPHTVPLWGIWFENRVFFDGHPQTKWIRNLMANNHVSVHVPSPEQVCIIEGKAVIIDDNDLTKEEWDVLDQTYVKKYDQLVGSPYIYIEPNKILVWDTSTFEHMTIWNFT